MENIFIGKNNKPYSINELEVGKIVKNSELLSMYSMNELDTLYKKYYGEYVHTYSHILSEKIKIFDNSETVNSFIFNGLNFWFDKNTRIGLMNLINCSTDNILLVLKNEVLTYPIDFVKDFLMKLEIYASLCYLQTQKHLSAVKELKTREDFLNYDYTTGYPEKITLE